MDEALKKKKRRYSLELTEDLWQKLEAAAIEDGVPIIVVIRRYLNIGILVDGLRAERKMLIVRSVDGTEKQVEII